MAVTHDFWLFGLLRPFAGNSTDSQYQPAHRLRAHLVSQHANLHVVGSRCTTPSQEGPPFERIEAPPCPCETPLSTYRGFVPVVAPNSPAIRSARSCGLEQTHYRHCIYVRICRQLFVGNGIFAKASFEVFQNRGRASVIGTGGAWYIRRLRLVPTAVHSRVSVSMETPNGP